MCKRWLVILFTLLLSTLLIACGEKENNTDREENQNIAINNDGNNNEKQNSETEEPEEEPEEVTLKFAYGWGEEDFNNQYKEHIEKALPHITLEWVDVNIGVAEDVEELLATGT